LKSNCIKDAQAAIYGVQGANGVILVTKSGRRILMQKIAYNTYTGFQETSILLMLLNM
jgi:TonB-dependent SusC/RagA subfamily outer membrane receptor